MKSNKGSQNRRPNSYNTTASRNHSSNIQRNKYNNNSRRSGVSRNTYYGNYNNDSLARDFYYGKNQGYQGRNVRNGNMRKRESSQATRQLNMPKTIITILMCFSLLLCLLCFSAINSKYRTDIALKQAELSEIMSENQYLQTSLKENIDLNKIAKEAVKLGLQKPQAYQITEVEVPNESYTVQYDTEIEQQSDNIIDFFVKIIKEKFLI